MHIIESRGRVRAGLHGGLVRLARLLVPGMALVCAAASPAAATGSFGCSADDKAVAFEAEAVFSYGLGEPFSNFRSRLSVKGKGAPAGLADLELDGQSLVHHWLHGTELKLRLYHERAEAPHGSVELVIETRRRPDDETDYAGRYVLRVFEVGGTAGAEGKELIYKGKVTCSVG